MGAKWLRKWAGGRVRAVAGREVYVIERLGRTLTLDVRDEQGALAELALFNRDPLHYQTLRAQALAAAGDVAVTLAAVPEFLAWAATQGYSTRYVRYRLQPCLAEWGDALQRRDLRKVKLSELRAVLKGKPAEGNRIVALKAFTAWLRQEGRLARSEDPTLELKVPQGRPEMVVRLKGYGAADLERAYGACELQMVRDVMVLRLKTGMHHTEIERIAAGRAAPVRVDDPCGIVGTVAFPHKTSRAHVVSLDSQGWAAMQRLIARGRAPADMTVRRELARAARRLGGGAVALHPGEFRHSFVTLARKFGRLVKPTAGGVSLEEVARVTGHTRVRTTSEHYDGTQVPAMVVLPLTLHHPSDPIQLDKRNALVSM